MLIPLSTDAPIYHYPITTISLIVINVLCFFAFCIGDTGESAAKLVDESGEEVSIQEAEQHALRLEAEGKDAEAYIDSLRLVASEGETLQDRLILQFGLGYRPWQWITSIFMHAGIMHLIGNMIFLWSFGLVVEGKVGNFAFAGLYLGMGCVQSFIEQTLMWFSVGGALGASGTIFSVLALVIIFSPVNSFEVLFMIFFRPITFEVSHLIFGGFYVAMNLMYFFLDGAQMGTEGLHLIGFFVGLPVGLFLLTRGYVDCEGYDLISHWKGKEGKKSKVGKKQRQQREKARDEKLYGVTPEVTPAMTSDLIRGQINAAIAGGNYPVAVALQNKLASTVPGAGWEQAQLAAVIKGFLKAKNTPQAEPLMHHHIEAFEQNRFGLQTYLIKLWLHGSRPRHALRYIKDINPAFLDADQIIQLRKLAAYAKKQIAEGVLEVE